MSEAMLDRAASVRRAALLTLIVVMPLIFLFDVTYDAVNTPKLAFLTAAISLVVAIRVVEFAGGRGLSALKALLTPVAFVTVPLAVAWALSPYRGWSLLGQYSRYQGLLPYLLLAVFGMLLGEAFRGRSLSLGWALLIAGAGAGLYGALEAFGLSPFIWTAGGGAKTLGLTQASATLGNPNFAGSFQSIVLPVGLGVWLADASRRSWATVCIGLSALGWFVSFSQGAWLAGAAGAAVTIGLASASRFRWARRAGFVAATLCAAAALAGVLLVAVITGPDRRSVATGQVRAWAWSAAVSMAAEHPVTGRGPNSFAVEGIQYRTPEETLQANYETDDPHSVFLSFLTAAGLLGGAGFLLFGVWIIRRIAAINTGGLGVALSAGFAGGAIAYLVQSLLSLDELSTRLALWTAISGLVTATARSEAEIGPRRHVAGRAIATLTAAAVLLTGIWWSARIFGADRHFLIGYRLAQDNLADEAVEAFDAALAARPDHYYRSFAGTKIGELGTRRDSLGAPYIEKMRETFSFVDSFPLVTAMESEADLLHVWATKGEPAAEREALLLYKRALTFNPGNPLLLAKLADCYVALGREDAALAVLIPLAGEPIRFARYWGTLAYVYARSGRFAEAEEMVDKAMKIDHKDARALDALKLLYPSSRG